MFLGKSCKEPTKIQNATIDYQGKLHYFIGQNLEVTCMDGYVFKGTTEKRKYITCDPALIWTGIDKIQCVNAHCSKPLELNAYNLSTLKDSYSIEESVNYSCPNGINRLATCKWNKEHKKAEWEIYGVCSGKPCGPRLLISKYSL